MSELGLTYFDIIAIVFVLLFVFLGISRGLMKELGKIAVWVCSLLGAKVLSFPLESTVYNFLEVDSKLLARVTDIVDKVDFTTVTSARNTLSNGLDNMSVLGPLLKGFTDDNWGITDIVQKGSANAETELIEYVMEGIQPIAHNVVNIGTFVGLFVILFVVLTVVISIIVNGLTSIKIVGAVDNLLGGAIGLIKGCLFIIILYSLLFVVLSVTDSNSLSTLMDSKFFDIVVGIKDILPAYL